MKLKNIIIAGLCLAIASTNVLAKDGKIKVGFMSGSELHVGEVAKKIAKEKYNLDVEIVEFTDYVTPNLALVDKSIDANAFQHIPYLEAQAKARGWTNLVPIAKTFTWPIVAYSKKFKTKEQITDGATVGIPNDPSNQGRSLLLLQAEGFIKLKKPTDVTQTTLDIVENPKNLKIKALDGNLLASALTDLDIAIINNTFAANAKLDPKKSLFNDGSNPLYHNLIVARTDNKDDPDLQTFVKAFQTDEVYQKALKEFDNFVIKNW